MENTKDKGIVKIIDGQKIRILPCVEPEYQPRKRSNARKITKAWKHRY